MIQRFYALDTTKKALLGFLAIAVCWHILVAMTSKITITSIFQAKPVAGYVWTEASNTDSRFFWQNKDVKWEPGIAHTELKLASGEREGDWVPLPGYAFIDKTKGLATVWQAHLKHPDFMAWSDDVEGKWIPVTGYRFVYEGDTFVETVWEPNKRYADLNVISLQQPDTYKPFPGYEFVDSAKSLKVVWTPGIPNSENPRLVAGTREGSWVVSPGSVASRSRYVRRGDGGRDARIFFGGVAAGAFLRGY